MEAGRHRPGRSNGEGLALGLGTRETAQSKAPNAAVGGRKDTITIATVKVNSDQSR